MKATIAMETLVKIAIAIVLAILLVLFVVFIMPSLSKNLGEVSKMLRF